MHFLLLLASLLAHPAAGVVEMDATSTSPHSFVINRDAAGLTIDVPAERFTYFGDGFVIRTDQGRIDFDICRWGDDEACRRLLLTQEADGSIDADLTLDRGFTDEGGSARVDERHCRAASFADFLEQHGDDVENLLRPALASIGRESVLCSQNYLLMRDDPRWQAPEEIGTTCECLLALCDDDDFRVRHWAAAAIADLGDEGAAYLSHRSRRGLSAEQSMRIDVILAEYPN